MNPAKEFYLTKRGVSVFLSQEAYFDGADLKVPEEAGFCPHAQSLSDKSRNCSKSQCQTQMFEDILHSLRVGDVVNAGGLFLLLKENGFGRLCLTVEDVTGNIVFPVRAITDLYENSDRILKRIREKYGTSSL
jgi:hypothetical protein